MNGSQLVERATICLYLANQCDASFLADAFIDQARNHLEAAADMLPGDLAVTALDLAERCANPQGFYSAYELCQIGQRILDAAKDTP